MKTSPTFPVLLVFLILLFSVGKYVIAQYPDCEPAPKLVRTNGASWPQGATITVVINPADFPTDEEKQAIKASFGLCLINAINPPFASKIRLTDHRAANRGQKTFESKGRFMIARC